MSVFIDALIASLNYDFLVTNRKYVKDIAFECIQYSNQHSHHKLLLKLCDMKLIDSEMITELITYNHAQLDLFPTHLIKPEHLLQGKIKSYPSYLKKYHYLMTPQIVTQLLQINFNSLPYLPIEMISREQVINYLIKYYPALDIERVNKCNISDIVKIYENYYTDNERYNRNLSFNLDLNNYFPRVDKKS
jgi:hypothetical protein